MAKGVWRMTAMIFNTSLSKVLDIMKLKANETSDSEYRNNRIFPFVKNQEDLR